MGGNEDKLDRKGKRRNNRRRVGRERKAIKEGREANSHDGGEVPEEKKGGNNGEQHKTIDKQPQRQRTASIMKGHYTKTIAKKPPIERRGRRRSRQRGNDGIAAWAAA